LNRPPDRAFDLALAALHEMGWDLVAADATAGRIEATDTTFWFGFKDDVVIRVRPADGGSRVDVRSLSRVGVGDVGTNAKRIRAYLDVLTEESRTAVNAGHWERTSEQRGARVELASREDGQDSV